VRVDRIGLPEMNRDGVIGLSHPDHLSVECASLLERTERETNVHVLIA